MSETAGVVPPMTVGMLRVDLPIIGAPMAGGPTTPELVAGVSDAGGLGTVAAGYLTPEALDERITAVRRLTDAAVGVNLFLSGPDACEDPGTARAVAEFARRLEPIAARYNTRPGEPVYSDEFVDAKVDVLARHRPALVSLTFGTPTAALVDRIHREVGAVVAITVTSGAEARAAADRGADVLIAQGTEAGGHRGVWVDDVTDPSGVGGPAVATADLVETVRSGTGLPVIAAGGITDGTGIRHMLNRGAVGVQLGTALLCCDEAGTSSVHRAALQERRYTETVVTRAFSGRPARALRNRFADEFADAPAAYPQVHHVTKPIRSAAAEAGDPEEVHLWAGTGWADIRTGPVAALMSTLRSELVAASSV